MKKRSLILFLVLVMCLTIPAYALQQVLKFTPSLSFSGTTVTAKVFVNASSADQVHVYATLNSGTLRIGTWADDGTGVFTFSRTATAEKGRTYTLTVTLTVNGERQEPVSITETY